LHGNTFTLIREGLKHAAPVGAVRLAMAGVLLVPLGEYE
jgi:hypothetical protein